MASSPLPSRGPQNDNLIGVFVSYLKSSFNSERVAKILRGQNHKKYPFKELFTAVGAMTPRPLSHKNWGLRGASKDRDRQPPPPPPPPPRTPLQGRGSRARRAARRIQSDILPQGPLVTSSPGGTWRCIDSENPNCGIPFHLHPRQPPVQRPKSQPVDLPIDRRHRLCGTVSANHRPERSGAETLNTPVGTRTPLGPCVRETMPYGL